MHYLFVTFAILCNFVASVFQQQLNPTCDIHTMQVYDAIEHQTLDASMYVTRDHTGSNICVLEKSARFLLLHVDSPQLIQDIEWSADGRFVAYELDAGERPDIVTKMDIVVLDLFRHNVSNLTDDITGVASEPSWSPDNTRIAFMSNHQGEDFAIYVVSLLDGKITLVADMPGTDSYPVWIDENLIEFYNNQTRVVVRLNRS